MSGKPLTHAERGRLGGMKAAQQMTPEQRSYRAYQGAAGLSDRLAERGVPLRYHMARLSLRASGKKVAL